MAIARLKRLLPYRESYIEIRELLTSEIRPLASYIRERGVPFLLVEITQLPSIMNVCPSVTARKL